MYAHICQANRKSIYPYVSLQENLRVRNLYEKSNFHKNFKYVINNEYYMQSILYFDGKS